MKWIKYQILQSAIGEQIVLANKKVGYSNENLAIAQKEAYDGYEIVDDEQSFEKEPLAIEFGGTNAKTAEEARANIGAAPSGYGLGTVSTASNATYVADANSATLTGWYKIDSNTTNGIGASAIMRVEAYASTYVMQTAIRANGGVISTRYCNNGTWGEWKSMVDTIGAAPIGYGLGHIAYNLPEVTDANSATNNGWYLLGKDAANGFGYRGVMRVEAYSPSYVLQTLLATGYSTKNPTVLQRVCTNGNWTEWGWVNPVLSAGIEYLTTERYDGNPVYCKLVDFGTLPNGFKSVNHGVTLTKGIRYEIITKNSETMLNNSPSITKVSLATSGVIQINTNTDMSAYNVYVAMWYCK